MQPTSGKPTERSGIFFGDPPDRKRRKGTVGETATLAELQALSGADSDFVVSQLSADATIDEARTALNKLLFDELEAAKIELSRREANRRF